MRACEGCRRRKIKCDAATTNTWPCSACIRLKLHCIPPTVNYDSGHQGFEQERTEYESGSGDDDYQNQIPLQQHLASVQKSSQQNYPQQISFSEHVSSYQPMPYAQHHPNQQPIQFASMNVPNGVMDGHFSSQNTFPMPPMQHQTIQQQQPQQPLQHASHSQSPESYQDQYGAQDLADYLGDLKMDETGSGRYPDPDLSSTGLMYL
jgi:hypothetical protein